MREQTRHPQFSTKGLVAYYKLWAGLTATVNVFDYALNGFTAAPVGTDIAPAYPGFRLNGADDFITITGDPLGIKTVAVWANPDDIAGVDGLVDLNFTDGLTIDTGTLTKNGFAGGTTVLYVDGEPATAVTANWHLSAITDTVGKDGTEFNIGNFFFGSFFGGLMGEVMLFDRVLTPAEIKSIYELTKWRYPNN